MSLRAVNLQGEDMILSTVHDLRNIGQESRACGAAVTIRSARA
jgi:hypothetical protein